MSASNQILKNRNGPLNSETLNNEKDFLTSRNSHYRLLAFSIMGNHFLNIGKITLFYSVEFCSRIRVDGADTLGTIHSPRQWCGGMTTCFSLGVEIMSKTTKKLSARQTQIFDVVCKLYFENGTFPSYREIGAFFPNPETGKPMFVNGVKGALSAIESRGLIENRGHGKARSTAITCFSEHDNRFGKASGNGRTAVVLPLNGEIQVQIHTSNGVEFHTFTHETAKLTAKHAGIELWVGNPYQHLAEIALQKM